MSSCNACFGYAAEDAQSLETQKEELEGRNADVNSQKFDKDAGKL
ncbi:MAG: hypothetical protein ACLTLQ_08030 [[Clostridium] scindens]